MNEGPEEVGPEGEELDMSGIFNEDGSATEEMEEKVSALANEDDDIPLVMGKSILPQRCGNHGS